MKEARRKIFASIFRWFILGIFLVIIAFSFFSYTQFEKIILSLLYESYRKNMDQTKSSIEYVHDSAKIVSLQIYNNEQLKKLFYYPELDGISTFYSMRQLDNYRQANNSLFHSIYIYNRRIDAFYISSSYDNDYKYPSKAIPDKEIVSLLNNSDPDERFGLTARYVPVEAIRGMDISVRVLTYIFRNLSINSNPDAAVIINISSSWIQSQLDILGQNSDNYAFVMDRASNIAIADNDLSVLLEKSNDNILKNIIRTGLDAGYYISAFNGKKSLISFSLVPSLDWYLVQITPYQEIISRISALRYRTVLGSIVFLIIGLLVSYIISNRIYRPLGPIIKRSDYLEKENSINSMELGYKYFVAYLREEINPDDTNLKQKLESLGFQFINSKYYIAVMVRFDEFNKYRMQFNKTERLMYKKAGLDSMNSDVLENIGGICVDTGEDQYFMIIQEDPDNISLFINNLVDKIKECLTTIHVNSFTTMYMNKIETIEETYGLQIKMFNISNKRWLLGVGSIMNCKDDYEEDQSSVAVLQQISVLEKELEEHIFSLEETEAIKDIGAISNLCRSMNYISARKKISSLTYSLLSDAIIPLYKKRNLTCPEEFTNFPNRLNESETLMDISNELVQMLESVMMQIKNKENNKLNEIIDRSLNLIRVRYVDPNLCLATISDGIGISPEYLGRIVKKSTGKSVADHINEVRLEKAYELLLSGNDTVKEITLKVGILNDQYFYTLFKKKYGMTPKEIRFNNAMIDTPR